MESASRQAVSAVLDSSGSYMDRVFLAYCETMQYGKVDHYAAPKEARAVAKSAERNAVDTLNRGIHRKSDDVEHFAMRSDKEWLGLWARSIEGLLSTGEHPAAEAYFAKHGIRA